MRLSGGGEALPRSVEEHAAFGREAQPHPRAGNQGLVEHLGSENFLHLRINGHRLVTLVPPGEQWQPGRRARLGLRRPLYFDAAGKTLAGAH